MNFISWPFVILFALVLLCRLTFGRSKTGQAYFAVLVAASLAFYGWHVPSALGLLGSCVGANYLAGVLLGRVENTTGRRLILTGALAVSFGILAYYKYGGFVLRLADQLAASLGKPGWEPPFLDIVLPVGISFYTFQAVSYTVDVFRREQEPETGFWRLLLYVAFFPQLMAGPIVRARQFLFQIDARRKPWPPLFSQGAYLLVQGLFLKMVVADNLGRIIDPGWRALATPGASLGLVLAHALCFSGQIFGDFAGYTLMARGMALLLGFRLPPNFNAPYIAASFSEFWRRWHITLSTWFRDYVYIPLGGGRRSRLRVAANLIATMGLCGLWHGAGVKFVIWGGLHGLGLAVERLLGLNRGGTGVIRALWFTFVQGLVLLAWIYFRSDTFGEANAIVANLFSGGSGGLGAFPVGTAGLLLLPLALLHLRVLCHEQWGLSLPGRREKAVLAGAMLAAVLTCHAPMGAQFIYFQF